MSGCRIGKVRFKNGTELRVIPSAAEASSAEVVTEIRAWFDATTNDLRGQITGFVAIAWSKDQSHTISDWYGDQSHICRSLGPHFVAEAMRRRNARIDCKAIIDGQG